MKTMKNKANKEKIINIPNMFTLLRVIITFIIIYLIFDNSSITLITILFILGMATDALDGHIARRFNQKTDFGRRFDILADRFLLIGTVLSLLVSNPYTNYLNMYSLFLIMLVLSREIISLPFALLMLYSRSPIPHVRIIGKAVTVMQFISFPMVLLKLNIAVYFVLITSILGIISGFYFIYDSLNTGFSKK
jgi:CDP-diacylglycerol--glycerol-3-phosphate 3-phosphatidyltransferase